MDQETPPRADDTSSPPPVIYEPVSAQDFDRGRRRVILIWVAGVVLAILAALWFYRRSADPVEAQQYLDAGQRLFRATRYSEAIVAFDHSISLQSDLADAYLRRGRAKAAVGGTEAAIEDFTRFIKLRPGSAEGWVERASAYLQMEDYRSLLADANHAIELDPKLSYAYALRGTALRKSGNLPEAAEAFSHAVELAPELDNYFQRAATYQLMGEHKLAIADLNQVIAIYPSSPMGYLARAKSREILGDLAGASSDREASRMLENRKQGQ